LKSCCVLQDRYDDMRDKLVSHSTIPDLQDQDQDRFFLVSDRSCPRPTVSGDIAEQNFPVLLCQLALRSGKAVTPSRCGVTEKNRKV